MGILATELEKDLRGNIKATPSKYNPSQAEKDRIAEILYRFNLSYQIQHKPFAEFNDMSLIHRMNKDQRSFNTWQEPISRDPDEEWKSRAVRPIVRNKIISIAAHITANILFPKIFAQNKNDESDKEAAEVMRDIMEWWADESNYEKNFLYAVIGALVNPATIVYTEFAQTMRSIKDVQPDGSWTVKQVLDDLYSGFNNFIVPVDELFIENVYESDIQKQGYLIWRRVISYSQAQARYNTNENFKKYVRAGIQTIFGGGDDTFYDQYDQNMTEDQVEEIVYWNRNDDLRLVLINGVLMSHYDQPNPRKDKKYPFAKTGYELFDEGKFFYYRSLANKTSIDEEVVNTLYRMIIDGTYLELMPPTAIYGDEDVDTGVVAPGAVTVFDGETKMERFGVRHNISEGRATLEKVEASVSESSVDKMTGGQMQDGTPPTAFELSRVEQNARTMLGLFGKMIAFLVREWGELAVGDITQFLTVGEYMALTSETGSIKFRNLVVNDKVGEDGTKKDLKIEFNHELPETPSKEDIIKNSFRIMKKEKENGMQVVEVNPLVFRNNKYKVRVNADIVTPNSDSVEKAMNLEAYDRAIANPNANQEAIYRDLLLGSYEKTKDNPDKYITKQQQQGQQDLASLVGAK